MFEINDTMLKNRKEVDAACGKFCLLMDVLFSKMSTIFFLLDDKQSNIFRLVRCNVKCGKENEFNLKMFDLSIFTLCYSIMVAMTTISDIFKAYEFVFK